MESLADVPQGSWPVSELNFLRQQTILTDDMLDTLAIHHPITGRQALELAYRAFGKTSCTVNNDYDCDGRINSQDNCSATYNPSQTDTDDDGMGDVCDDDIDNDGLTNPVGIVDEWNTINIDLIDETDDQCLWDATPSAICSSIPWYGLRIQASLGTARNGALPPLSAQAIQYQP
ncbi:MAG: thrombospondin type 3 repeat-containing protein [Candidatus Peribacteria bacterium]|nr:MAG: thrombospondin type 3 repeat-containing protein [Candidatus Peribacteria bacterium]